MTEYVDEFNMNDAMLSANILSVKEEQCEEDNQCVEDKVCISETTLTVNNAELQGHIWPGKIKQYEEPTYLNSIKTEGASFQATAVQNDNVKIEGSISADIKIECDRGLLYCEHCEAYYVDYCIECGMLVRILNKDALNNADSGTQADIPSDILEIQNCLGQTGIYALRIIPAGVKLGPFTGLSATECPWEMNGEKFTLDKHKWKHLNWMQYVNPTRNTSEANLHVFRSEDNIYYQSTCRIQAGEELLVYFGEEYGNSPNKIIKKDFVMTMKDMIKDVFACTFCCLGFSSKSHLVKHKTTCVKDTVGTFAIEELAQCQFCKIHLDSKEYVQHHMAFCCARNARKGILSTPSAKAMTTALNGRKRSLRKIYKCEHCKYRTKYQADLKEHTDYQHYEVKMYKCGICNRRFKTNKSLKLHVKNSHARLGGNDDQTHSTTGYRNTYIKVEQTSSRDKKKIFKCTLCVFRAKYKRSIKRHIQAKHLKQFDFKCDSCKYVTNDKNHLEVHIKTKHLKKFDYKCNSCEFGTNSRNYLEGHIKTKHLKQFDFKCDSCEFGTNSKKHLELHIKTKHLKQFDYKCDSCEFRTNRKHHLGIHKKTKHSKEFDYKCDSCEFGTHSETVFKKHVKTKHLKQFDFKCEFCELGTNSKPVLQRHIKTKHLKEFDFKCESCEFATNAKTDLERHIKSIHLKQFDYKCDSCEYGTNIKRHVERHIKAIHVKEFEYKCHLCEFGTNIKTNLKRHIKTIHLYEFDYKCESCEYRTNIKRNLDYHVKTTHLKQFDFKCDKCAFGTNRKDFLEIHMKRKHL